MKPGNQRIRFTVRCVVPAFFCLAVTGIPSHADELSSVSGSSEPAARDGAEAQRQKRIEECQNNRGVDCEQEVDTELGAEEIGGRSMYIPPDQPIQRPITPRPRPIPRPRPSR